MSELLRVVSPEGLLAAALDRVVPALAASVRSAGEAGEAAAEAMTRVMAAGELETADEAAASSIVTALALAPHRWDVAVLAALADGHEAFGAALRLVHPHHLPYPTVGLVARTVAAYRGDRVRLRGDLEGARAAGALVSVADDGPFPERTVRPLPGLWSVLVGGAEWPAPVRSLTPGTVTGEVVATVDHLVATPLGRILGSGRSWDVVVRSDHPTEAAHRVALLGRCLGLDLVILAADPAPAGDPAPAADLPAVAIHALARSVLPVVVVDGDGPVDFGDRPDTGSPVVVCTRPGVGVAPGAAPFHDRPLAASDPGE
ncbi:MAG: hypothetical protein ACK5PP_05630, partial [Acidimicrobiales bacterium]